jgi:hypothetical protein
LLGIYMACTHTVCEHRYVQPPIVTAGFILKNFLGVAHIRENTIIWYLIRDYLSFATLAYLNTSTNKIHITTSNVNNT